MYRYEIHVQVQMGRWKEFQAQFDALNGALAGKELRPFQLWSASFSTLNAARLVVDHESLAAYERWNDAVHADAACMGALRELFGAPVAGIPRVELWWQPATPG